MIEPLARALNPLQHSVIDMQTFPSRSSNRVPAQLLQLLGGLHVLLHHTPVRASVLLRPPVVAPTPPPASACLPVSSAISDGLGRVQAALLGPWPAQAVLLVQAQVRVRHLCTPTLISGPTGLQVHSLVQVMS